MNDRKLLLLLVSLIYYLTHTDSDIQDLNMSNYRHKQPTNHQVFLPSRRSSIIRSESHAFKSNQSKKNQTHFEVSLIMYSCAQCTIYVYKKDIATITSIDSGYMKSFQQFEALVLSWNHSKSILNIFFWDSYRFPFSFFIGNIFIFSDSFFKMAFGWF